MTIGHRVVRLDWFGAWDAHTIRLLGGDSSHLDLLVIPRHRHRSGPGLSGDGAGQDVSPNQRGGVLATCGPTAPRRAPRRAEPEHSRWETDGGRIRHLA
jgi:hypothetical protein